MATFKVVISYPDGTTRTLETPDGAMAIREAGNQSYEEKQSKTITIEKDGSVIYTEKVKAHKQNADIAMMD